MAVRDFKKYLVKIQGQYLEMKQDLNDFNIALKDGYITEDQLAGAKQDVEILEQNYQRLLYVAYLLELPNRTKKQDKYKRSNKKVFTALENFNADENSVFNENKSALDHLRAELKLLKKSQ